MVDYSMSLRQTLDFIEKNLENKITLDELAKKAYLSKYHYHRLFHKLIGESPSRYIVKKRMDAAAKELAETKERIIDIAVKYQFGSQEAFSRAFRRAYGMAPGVYRRQILAERASAQAVPAKIKAAGRRGRNTNNIKCAAA